MFYEFLVKDIWIILEIALEIPVFILTSQSIFK